MRIKRVSEPFKHLAGKSFKLVCIDLNKESSNQKPTVPLNNVVNFPISQKCKNFKKD